MVIEAMRRPLVQRLADAWEVPVSDIEFMGRLGVSDLEYLLDIAQEMQEDNYQSAYQDGYDEGSSYANSCEYDRGFDDGQASMASEVDQAYQDGLAEGKGE